MSRFASDDAVVDSVGDILLPGRRIPKDLYYRCDRLRRGIALIFNQEEFEDPSKLSHRKGSGVDARSIADQLKALNFDVSIQHNSSAQNMFNIIRKTAKQDHTDADCFACVILSHGEEGGIVYGRDGPVKLDDLIAPFKGDVCQTLAGKPKLFFIQACRGTELDHGVNVTDGLEETDGGQPFRKIPTEADFLLAFSVTPGHYSWRNSTRGSWFIQALSEMLEKYGNSLDILSILTRVSHKVAYEFQSNASTPEWSAKKQVPCIVSMLTKDVYFFPKSPTN